MTTLAPSRQRVIPLIHAQTPAVGDSARQVAMILRGVAMHEGDLTASWRRQVRGEIEEVARECAFDNWDGYNARAISQRTTVNAARFVDLLPADLPEPSVVPAPNGHIALTWDFGRGRILTISIGESTSAAYAGILGNEVRRHGVESFRDDVAKILVESIREVARAG